MFIFFDFMVKNMFIQRVRYQTEKFTDFRKNEKNFTG